jgi:hypothetical protein
MHHRPLDVKKGTVPVLKDFPVENLLKFTLTSGHGEYSIYPPLRVAKKMLTCSGDIAIGVSVIAESHDRLEKVVIRPFSMCPRGGESIFASAMIDWRRIRKNSSISEELIRAKFEEKKNSSEFFDYGAGVVHQEHEDEKNSSEFFEPKAEPPGASKGMEKSVMSEFFF